MPEISNRSATSIGSDDIEHWTLNIYLNTVKSSVYGNYLQKNLAYMHLLNYF
jgi:hypothetical protein